MHPNVCMLGAMRSAIVASATISLSAWFVIVASARGDDALAVAVPDDAAPADDAIADAGSDATDSSPHAANDAATLTDASTEPSNTGFAFGLRAGARFPVGRVSSRPIGDVIVSSVPFTADLGYFITAHLYVGLFGTFALATSSSADTTTCPSGADCTARRWQLGALAAWHFRPSSLVDPHIGLGVAYDLVNLTASDSVKGNVVESSALQGIEFLDLHVGIDIRPKPYWGVGPTLDASMGTYASGGNVHGWLGGGLRLFSVL